MNMSVSEKRERVEALQQQIEDRKAKHASATAEASEQVREQTLDREIDRLEAELAAFNEVPVPTGEVSGPEALGGTGQATEPELREMAASLGVQDVNAMNQDELIGVSDATTEGDDS